MRSFTIISRVITCQQRGITTERFYDNALACITCLNYVRLIARTSSTPSNTQRYKQYYIQYTIHVLMIFGDIQYTIHVLMIFGDIQSHVIILISNCCACMHFVRFWMTLGHTLKCFSHISFIIANYWSKIQFLVTLNAYAYTMFLKHRLCTNYFQHNMCTY